MLHSSSTRPCSPSLSKIMTSNTSLFIFLFLLIYQLSITDANTEGDTATVDEEGEEVPERFQVAKINWHEVQTPYIIGCWLLLACIAKILFHISKRITDVFPDSSLLIMVGLIVGIILNLIQVDHSQFLLNSTIFFLFLLPPIVFDAGYFMPNRAFFDNIGSILVFAVLGTLFNTTTIGLSLYSISRTGLFSVEFNIFEIFLFASLISAVDPVAVIAVFEEIHVNEVLYINVFGESLLNDGVTVVLYNMFKTFSLMGADNLITIDYVAGFISFFCVALGGIIIGLIWAMIVSFTTKYTRKVKVLNPIFIFLMPYMAYLTAELFGLSSILAIVFCGITMKQYIKGNISDKAATSVKYFTKMLSQCSETAIFMFLGLSTVSSNHHWDTAFIVLTVMFCFVYRATGVVIQAYFINKFRLTPFSKIDQFVMAYGGLRGAIAYGLVVSMPNSIEAKNMFITACIVVIYFTVFLQGMTMKPLVNFLKVEKAEKHRKTMAESMLERVIDYTMTGVEDICGSKGHNWLRDVFESFNSHYMKPLLMRNTKRSRTDVSKMMRAYRKITVKEALDVSRGRPLKSVNSQFSINVPTRSRTSSVGSNGPDSQSMIANDDILMTISNGHLPMSLDDETYQRHRNQPLNVETIYTIFNELMDQKLKGTNIDDSNNRRVIFTENAIQKNMNPVNMMPRTSNKFMANDADDEDELISSASSSASNGARATVIDMSKNDYKF